MCIVIGRLAKEQLEMFGSNVAFPAIVTNCGANMRKALNSTLEWDWLCRGCHLIHNIVTAGFPTLRNNMHILTQTEARNVNKRLTGEKCELLSPSAFSFFKCVRNMRSCG